MAIINDQTSIGLANRFVVTIEPGSHSLGSWQKCEGLDVTWDMPEYRSGDAGNFRVFFPANTKYAAVKLMRAASKDDTKLVKTWLEKNQFTYMESRSDITIELMDSSGKPVHSWTCRSGQPKKWSINSMDAGASQVAIETLEFEHEGFLDQDHLPGH